VRATVSCSKRKARN